MLMDRLDRSICLAEEKYLLDKLDMEILKAEEEDLLQRLLRNIEEAAENTHDEDDDVVRNTEETAENTHDDDDDVLRNIEEAAEKDYDDDDDDEVLRIIEEATSNAHDDDDDVSRIIEEAAEKDYDDDDDDDDVLRIIEEATSNAHDDDDDDKLRADSVVSHVERPGQQSVAEDTNATNLTWSGLEYLAKRKRKRPSTTTTTTTTTKPSNAGRDCYSNVEPATACFRKKLPKYLDSSKQRLFTRGDFRTGVLHEWEQEMEQRCPPNYKWKARLLDDCPNDPNACLLEVTAAKALREMSGQQKLLDMLRNNAADWIRSRIHLYNSRKLLGDGESLLMDLSIPPKESIGARFQIRTKVASLMERKYAPQDGIWMTGIRRKDIGLAKSLGSSKVFHAGFAIVAINNEPCTSPEKLREMALKKSDQPAVVTICLSKYADLQGVDLAKHPPRRRDLKPFSMEYYAGLKTMRRSRYRTPVKSLPMTPPRSKKEIRKLSAKIMKDMDSISISMILSAAKGMGGLGATFTETNNGLWVSDFKQGKQLRNLLGSHPCTWGVLLTKANGVATKDTESLQRIIGLASSETFRATFIAFDGIDLGELDQSRLVQGRPNPLRLDGGFYSFPGEEEHDGDDENQEEEEDDDVQDFDTGGGNDDHPTAEQKGTSDGSNKRKATNDGPRSHQQSLKRSRLEDKHNLSDSSVEGPSERSRVEGPSQSRFDKVANFRRFKDKYKPFVDIEYKGTDISNMRAYSSMWDRHKELFGEEHLCDDACICYARTKRLSKNVAEDYVAFQQKKGNPVGSVETAGIADHFAPRFLRLLKKEYPKLKPSEFIQRLSAMWKFHQMNSMFGIKCNKNCQCREEWEGLFCKGDIGRAEEESQRTSHHSSKRRKLDTSSDTSPAKAPGITGGLTIPRKSQQGVERTVSAQKTYEITFDTHAPLGAYFVNDGDKCKVHSIYSKGQFKKDTRLAPGKCSRNTEFDFSTRIQLTLCWRYLCRNDC
jgi:hypothetical protein